MAHFVLSDDLTGASGVASMVGASLAATVSLSRFDRHITEEFPFIAINLEARESSPQQADALFDAAMTKTDGSWTALRIDSALRGPVAALVRSMSYKGVVLLTDTIPEYNRRTVGGRTIVGAQEKDLREVLALALGEGRDERVLIADSETTADLRLLAQKCAGEDLIPVDPGPLVAMVASERLHAARGPLGTRRRALLTPSQKVAFVIGTRDGMTLRQLEGMEEDGFIVRPPAPLEPEEVSVFAFSLQDDAALLDNAFVASMQDYDALVLSGGATASLVLERAGFDCIVNGPQIQPLLSTGTVRGGVLDGKTVVLKGGFIGDENTYKTILGWLKQK